MLKHETEILKNFLSIYWLRPETAIWRTLDALQLRQIKFLKPIVDIGCGDGIFTFTTLGGKIDVNYDVYRTMKKTDKFFNGVDIHDQKSDINFKIIKQPKISVDLGLDWKHNLLKKAEKLKIYQKLVKHDANKQLPIQSNEFKTVFSNTFYWMDDIEHILSESKRICHKDGKIIIFVPDKKFKESLIFNQYFSKGDRWAKMLDRGISNNMKHCYSLKEWKSLFSKVGLKIDYHSNYGTEELVKFWSIGLRPYSPYLIEMSNNVNLKIRTKIKQKLINDLTPMLKSYVEYEMSSIGKNNCFHLFILKKS
jgi:trans-aconitate methyltransferase